MTCASWLLQALWTEQMSQELQLTRTTPSSSSFQQGTVQGYFPLYQAVQTTSTWSICQPHSSFLNQSICTDSLIQIYGFSIWLLILFNVFHAFCILSNCVFLYHRQFLWSFPFLPGIKSEFFLLILCLCSKFPHPFLYFYSPLFLFLYLPSHNSLYSLLFPASFNFPHLSWRKGGSKVTSSHSTPK